MRHPTSHPPHSQASPKLPEPPPGASAATAGPILLVDDDPAVCQGLQRVLAIEGWNVVTAKGGAEALEYLRENEPSLMITDLWMGPVSGWDLLYHETMQRPELPVFVITALSPFAAKDAAAFATEFFQKPVDLDLFLATIRYHLAGGSGPLPRPRYGSRPSR